MDISGYTSDAMADFDPASFDAVISCCGCGNKLNDEKAVWKKRALFEDWALDDPPAIDPGDLSEYVTQTPHQHHKSSTPPLIHIPIARSGTAECEMR